MRRIALTTLKNQGLSLAGVLALFVSGCQDAPPDVTPSSNPTAPVETTAPGASPTATQPGVTPTATLPVVTPSATLPVGTPTASATPVGPSVTPGTPSPTPSGPTPTVTPADNDLDDDGFTDLDGDCDDTDPDTYPGAHEVPYDGIDQDCQDGDLIDVDGDSYPATQAGGTDCDDTSANTYPGATEFEDDLDNDCDGQIDEALDTTDDDGDGYSESTGDCDDGNPDRAPGKTEIPYDGIDQDCSGADLTDIDQDGFAGGEAGNDCNDTEGTINPGAEEIPYDGIDQNCTGADLVDQDGDGAEGGPDGTDCDDLDPGRSPLLAEIPYDGVDQDCSGADLVDVDGDGQHATQAGGTDCNDTDVTIYLGAIDVPYDGIDQDCSGADLTDVDSDTYPATQAGGTDCDDTSASTYPGAPEFEDDKDNDCDGQIDEELNTNDDDGDTFTEATGDCNDADASVYPGATEIPYDGVDQDCSGLDLTDVDGDGFAGGTGPDCNDNDVAINPAADDIPYDGIDQDCSSADLTDVDGDGFDAEAVGGDDCDDTTGLIHPGATEVPYDAIDQDCDDQDLVDVDNDGFIATQAGGDDCNDDAAAIHPDASEVCDGVDNNCDSVVDTDAIDRGTYYIDADGDTYGDPTRPVTVCTPSASQVANSMDCNDASASSYPGATELCDYLDNDCDSQVDEDVKTPYFADTDGDLYGDANDMVEDCEAPDGYVEDFTDCDDLVSTTNPGALEVCNEVDDNCDDAVDEGVLTSYYPDSDGDGFGVTEEEVQLCEAPTGYVETPGDCDDLHSSAHPGGSEVCDPENVDEDCNGSADDADPGVDASTKTTWYRDSDGDGYGSSAVSTVSCDAPAGYVANGTDCNAANADIHPGASELPGDSVDQNCDGAETCFKDADDDGYRPDSTSTVASSDKDCLDAAEATGTDPLGDCNDRDGAINPAASELTGDAVDQNCDGQETCFKDGDNDGYRPDVTSTTASSDPDCSDSGEAKAIEPAGDCDDTNVMVNPGMPESAGDSFDQNCDGVEMCYTDADNDGYRPNSSSTTGSADTDCTDAFEAVSSDPTGDCNDSDATIKPGATDAPGDSIDQNCDAVETCFKDADDDGYRPDATSTTPSSDSDCADAAEATATDPTGDCDDTKAAVKPGATEVSGDSIDQNCDGLETCFTDADNDGYRPNATSTVASTDTDCADANEAIATDPTGDCNDGNAAIKPGVAEVAGDSIDQNCDGGETCYKDADDDGYRPDATSTTGSTDTDCADTAEALSTDPTGDCNDNNASIKPGATEAADGVDQNCNGSIDEGAAHTSCSAWKTNVPSSPSGIYSIDPDGTSGALAPFQVYCDMTTSGGGWTLTMKMNGNSTNFRYDSGYWTGNNTLNPSSPGLDQAAEAKLNSYNTVPFSAIMIGMNDGAGLRYVSFTRAGSSLLSLIAPGTYLPSSIGRNAWKSLMTSPSLQPSCNMEGINPYDGCFWDTSVTGVARVRIGIIANQEGDCCSPDSRIGVGGMGSYCGQDPNNSAGNEATCSGDGGDVHTKAWAYVFVR